MPDSVSTEQAILEAAEAEFMEKGFSGARTVSIAQAAGVTHAMFHYYFRTKEQLFERVLSSKLSLMIDSVFDSLANAFNEDDVIERIATFTRCHYEFLVNHPALPRFIINEVVHNPERMELLKSRLSDKFKNIDSSFGIRFAHAIEKGRIAHVDIQTIITDIIFLNLSSILMRPVFKKLTQRHDEDYDSFRLEENITLIKKRLLP